MYRCEQCGDVVGAGQAAIKMVVETRQREYPPRANPGGGAGKNQGRSRRRRGDSGGSGREIVRELLLCVECSEAWSGQEKSEG